MVGEESIRDPEKARKLLLTGYRLQEKRLQLFPDRKLPASGQYVARVVMQNIIKALAKCHRQRSGGSAKRLAMPPTTNT